MPGERANSVHPFLVCGVGVDLGRAEALVPEERANGRKAGAIADQLGGEGVAQGMRRGLG